MTKTEQICKTNEEIVEELFKDFRSILYTQRPLKIKMRMLYAAKHSADYFMSLNNAILREFTK